MPSAAPLFLMLVVFVIYYNIKYLQLHWTIRLLSRCQAVRAAVQVCCGQAVNNRNIYYITWQGAVFFKNL